MKLKFWKRVPKEKTPVLVLDMPDPTVRLRNIEVFVKNGEVSATWVEEPINPTEELEALRSKVAEYAKMYTALEAKYDMFLRLALRFVRVQSGLECPVCGCDKANYREMLGEDCGCQVNDPLGFYSCYKEEAESDG